MATPVIHFFLPVNMTSFDFSSYTNGNVNFATFTSTNIEIDDSNGDKAYITGNNFSYNFATGEPSGTATGATLKNAMGQTVATATGLNVDLSTVYNDRSNEPALFNDIFSPYVMKTVNGVSTKVYTGVSLIGSTGNDYLLGGLGPDVLNGVHGTDTLDGGTGYNSASFASASAGVTVSLGVTTAQVTGGGETVTLKHMNGLIGSKYDDHLTGNAQNNTLNGGAGNDVLNGVAGNNTLIGGLGQDTMTGGAGNNQFIYSSIAESTVAAPDRITDWHGPATGASTSTGDKINLVAIGKTVAGGLHFGPTAGHTGDVVVTATASATVINVYTNSDSTPDMRIVLSGDHVLTYTDFKGVAAPVPAKTTATHRFTTAMAAFSPQTSALGSAAGHSQAMTTQLLVSPRAALA